MTGGDRLGGLLRGLQVWDRELPAFDPDTAPEEPLDLFAGWFAEAVAAGEVEPHTMTLATADAAGDPDARTVMLHGADERGWQFATNSASAKGRQLAARPRAALHFYWPALARQVRLRGTVTAAGPEESAADLARRSPGALAAALVGRQSEVLDTYGTLRRAADAAWERVQREPDATVPGHTLYLLAPDRVEFFQGDARRRHVRVNYRRERGGWARELLWP